MKSRIHPLRALLALVLVLGSAGVQAATPDFSALISKKTRAFFAGQLAPTDFSVTAPWRKNFDPKNLAARAPLVVEKVELTEIRLPDNPNGLEGLFAVKARLSTPAWIKDSVLEAGDYWLPGSITFVHTTEGWLVRDVDFAVLDAKGEVRGANHLPWSKEKKAEGTLSPEQVDALNKSIDPNKR